eukprot:CAMPEP_0116157348 /NCGR_PEP_ID=MMETSP0329-20121206/23298_1 /TAXON_ID=697910 /ORGANISM="Pseudo-nitzschia arenysensis, Strain B593" /LENGTH=1587 /DNA_ID=CAMNT_0003654453 /DNA_START=285 /DNA_END=5048 /DNA_ORIENTATION=+
MDHNDAPPKKVKIREEDGSDRLLTPGLLDYTRCDNTLITSKFTILNFLPINIKNQFRKFGNMYFLIVGFIMWLGTRFPTLFKSAFHPSTTWGPIAIFISISLLNEGMADKKRHDSDYRTNTFQCFVLENTANPAVNAESKKSKEDASADEAEIPCDDVAITLANGGSTTVGFHPIKRRDIRQGHIVFIRNREMIPADTVLLASSGDRGCAYIETSSIDGETNLKLRVSAKHKTDPSINQAHESIEEALRRIAGFTAIGCPGDGSTSGQSELTTEPPNAHINTFSGLLKLPKLTTIDEEDSPSEEVKLEVPLGAENLLLRGSVLRNTEWAIGIACFTGTDTKLSQNTIEAPAKFSQLDLITNKLVIVLIFVELICIAYLSTLGTSYNRIQIDTLWYLGRKRESNFTDPWPYLPNLEAPKWSSTGQNWFQYALTNITLLSYFVPLSMYFNIECCNFFLMWLMYVDPDMYDATTDTRAEARSTIYTDLGQIQYIFSDKTGTLTQNVMRFKRCSIDGMVFGRPVIKANPSSIDARKSKSSFLPLRRVLAGQVNFSEDGSRLENKNGMTFNAELFLRVMSLCHTVVVEKDLDTRKGDNGEEGVTSIEDPAMSAGPDGAPIGYAYQAESPDEGALVSASANTFGFQVLSRDSAGIRLQTKHPTLFRDKNLVEDLKSGKVDPSSIAAESASGLRDFDQNSTNSENNDGTETWSVLAVNKFDSTRKRMSILLRSPPEYGSCPILFCKGADSAMLDPGVSASSQTLYHGSNEEEGQRTSKNGPREDSEWEMAKMLGIETHLGEFATEGLRTLVLGVRFLTDDQCDKWLEKYNAAATAIKGRDKKLTRAAFAIERDLHIVGATAIEDKLQVNVPNTISQLEKAGIKLWVLTGDKRETAVEIGYSTKVLTPHMHLTQVADHGEEFVRAQCAMEFMRLVKAGKLPLYQRAAVDKDDKSFNIIAPIISFLRNLNYLFWSCLKQAMLYMAMCVRRMLGMKITQQLKVLDDMKVADIAKREHKDETLRRRNVRNRAEAILREYSKNHPSISNNQFELSNDALPPVFNRASSAKETLDKRRAQGKLSEVDKRASRLSQITAQELAENHDMPVIEDDMLSLQSFMPQDGDKAKSNFDKKKRSMLERAFAVDRDVRKGRLVKHLKKEKRIEAQSRASSPLSIVSTGEGPRALVIEGAALKHLQGDSELEELVFNIASQCIAVIACRVTPRQKAQLVKLVRRYVEPEPVTLAIGDGANDVGMIHAAHVGIGISGKEGQQAVNAADFAIGQFRFLEDLILYHGRWNFLRTTMVVLYTFYKNAVIALLLVLYNNETLFSGTSIFDQWLMAGYSFVCFAPIITIGFFDRNLEKPYIKKNPEVYKHTQQNEMITPRTKLRWAFITLAHVGILYYGQVYQLSRGCANTSAFMGLMSNWSSVGDGEVADWQSLGTTVFTSLILLMGYKQLYEARSIINGKFPAFTAWCKKTEEGYISRIPYTWYGILYGTIVAYALCMTFYNYFGAALGSNASTFFSMVWVPSHVFLTSATNYILILFIPIGAMVFDVAGKVFSNMFYPSQNQIHIELESEEIRQQRKFKTVDNERGSEIHC